MARLRTLLFLMGTVIASSNGSVIRPYPDIQAYAYQKASQPFTTIPWSLYPMYPQAYHALGENKITKLPSDDPYAPGAAIVNIPYGGIEVPHATAIPPLSPDCTQEKTQADESLPIPEVPALPALVLPEPPQTIEKEIIEEEPIRELINVPAAPQLPPFTMPQLPIKVEEMPADTPCFELEIPSEPTNLLMDYPKVPQVPQFPEFVMPAVQLQPPREPEKHFLSVPEAPTLPHFTMPEIPIKIEEQYMLPEPMLPIPESPQLPPFKIPELTLLNEEPQPPCDNAADNLINSAPMPEMPAKEEETHFVVIPEAPMLPQFTMPELPQKFEEPHKLPVAELPAPTEESAHVFQNIELLAPIPQAPQLPPFAMPELIVHNEEPQPPCDNAADISMPPAQEAIIIPEMPALPLLTVNDLPAINEEPLRNPEPEMPAKEEDKHFITIPAAPMLPPFTMPALPVKVEEPYELPQAELPATEHIFQNIELLAPIPPPLPPLTMPESIVHNEETQPPCDQNISMPPAQEAIIIPAMPALPPLTLNDFPAIIEEPSKTPVPEMPTKEQEEHFLTIPAAPMLPPFTMPALPVKVEERFPEVPQLEDHAKPEEAPKAPCDNTFENSAAPVPMLPEVPHLPPFAMPSLPAFLPMPELPIVQKEPEPTEPMKPIPEAPRLPTFTMPELPALEIRPSEERTPEFISHPLMPLPDVPHIHPLEIQELPAFTVPPKSPCDAKIPCVSGTPQMPLFPTLPQALPMPIQYIVPGNGYAAMSPEKCADTIVQQRILPNLIPSIDIRNYSLDRTPVY